MYRWPGVFFMWFVSLLAMMGSLFFSEVMGFVPCSLCWYQRIAMYPLVWLFGIALFYPIKHLFALSSGLVICGWAVALMHNLIHYKVIPEKLAPCVEGVPCSTVYINWLGFMTIPMLSLIAFSLILFILIIEKNKGEV